MRSDVEIHDRGRGNTIEIGPIHPFKLRITILGNNNTVRIGPMGVRRQFAITIRHSNSYLEIGEGCLLQGVIGIAQGATVIIGREVTAQQIAITAQEGRRITIGDRCMFGRNVHIRNSDAHPIFDVATRQQINPAADTHIGDHVWGAHSTTFLKGSRIGMNSVVGTHATVSAGEYPDGALLVGSPANVVRTGIIWDRWFGDSLDDPALSGYLAEYIPETAEG
ncbi:acyltransferase [Acuticoccus mangrovi]|uniref:Transferase n=1 Tax=Acuticoccus mangrovi TaxID=2796142 RepID=A0A934IH14_9HYPH|nr:hypothetical protein [Acuticoccus mangrovi]MBJ3774841.1 hypothetical protein [Acuticoccus mangrovi]